MDRRLMDSLKEWKHRKDRKPMILRGARQVGKTWLMKEFGESCYKNYVYLRMDDAGTARIFSESREFCEILAEIEKQKGIQVIPGETLLILDEIQEAPQALHLLKEVCESCGAYHIIAAGSLLGLQLHEGISFPVGKVEFLDLYPLDFLEFLQAAGERRMADMLKENHPDVFGNFKDRYMDFLRFYYYVGGMPEAVLAFLETRDMRRVRTVQENLLWSYESDFSKHMSPEIAMEIKTLWRSIPERLMNGKEELTENKTALQWLMDSGLVCQVKQMTGRKPSKLYMLDVGLMGAMTGLNARTIVYGNKLFSEFNGILTQQYVFQQLKAGKENRLYYWVSDTSMGELDFLLQQDDLLIPVEIRTDGKKNTFTRVLKAYCNKYRPEYAIQTSESEFIMKDWMINLPLYGIGIWRACFEN